MTAAIKVPERTGVTCPNGPDFKFSQFNQRPGNHDDLVISIMAQQNGANEILLVMLRITSEDIRRLSEALPEPTPQSRGDAIADCLVGWIGKHGLRPNEPFLMTVSAGRVELAREGSPH